METETLTLIGLLDKHAAIFGTLFGAAIGSFGSIVIMLMTKRSEERKHMQSLAFNTGIEEYKQAFEYAKLMMREGKRKKIPPATTFIIGAMMTADLLQTKKFRSKEKLIEEYKKQKEISDGLNDWIMAEHQMNKTK